MKKQTKIVVITVLMLLITGAGTSVFAQRWDNFRGQTVSVDGTLQLQKGSIVLVSGNTSYFVPMLTRYVGFIDSLKEGAAVSIEGYADGYNMLMPTAMTINGKTYDLSGNAQGGGYGWGNYCGAYGDYGGRRHRGGGCGGRW